MSFKVIISYPGSVRTPTDADARAALAEYPGAQNRYDELRSGGMDIVAALSQALIEAMMRKDRGK